MTNFPFSIVVYGNSLVLSGVVMTLQQADVKLIQVNPNGPLAQDTLDAMRAGVLICDLSHYDAQVMSNFIFTHPDVTVVGVHFEEDRAITLICQESDSPLGTTPQNENERMTMRLTTTRLFSREHPLQAATALVQIIERELSVYTGRSPTTEQGGGL